MTAPTATPHITALIAHLKATLPNTVAVYDAEVPTAPSQTYVVLWPGPGARSRDALGSVVGQQWSDEPQITCVGTTQRQCVDVADAVAKAVLGHRLVVAGRQCWPITQVPLGQPVQRDDSARDVTDRPRFYVPTQWRIASIPTT